MSFGPRPFVLLLCAAPLVIGCGDKNKKGSTTKAEDAFGDKIASLHVPKVDSALCDTKSKRVETFDLNKDGRPDVWKLYGSIKDGGTQTEVLTCKQVDFDRDGVKDYVVTYENTGEMANETADLTFDDTMDARRHYDKKTGKVYLIERDTDFDKKPDVWEKFDADGVIESVRRDSNADGKPDVWEQYVKGELVAILYDEDFDNRVDRKEQVKVVTEKPPKVDTPSKPPIDEDKPGEPGDDGADDGKDAKSDDKKTPDKK